MLARQDREREKGKRKGMARANNRREDLHAAIPFCGMAKERGKDVTVESWGGAGNSRHVHSNILRPSAGKKKGKNRAQSLRKERKKWNCPAVATKEEGKRRRSVPPQMGGKERPNKNPISPILSHQNYSRSPIRRKKKERAGNFYVERG